MTLSCQRVVLALQEVEVKVLRWLHEEEATGVQYLEVQPPPFVHLLSEMSPQVATVLLRRQHWF